MKECPHCNKTYKNLKQHITKSHIKNEIRYYIDEEYGLVMTTVIYNGKERGNFGNTSDGELFYLKEEAKKHKKYGTFDDYSLLICHNETDITDIYYLGYNVKREPLYKHNWIITRYK
jgi:hypothetical protein